MNENNYKDQHSGTISCKKTPEPRTATKLEPTEMAPGKRPSRMRGDRSKLPQQGFETEEKEDNMPAEATDAEKPAAIKHKEPKVEKGEEETENKETLQKKTTLKKRLTASEKDASAQKGQHAEKDSDKEEKPTLKHVKTESEEIKEESDEENSDQNNALPDAQEKPLGRGKKRTGATGPAVKNEQKEERASSLGGNKGGRRSKKQDDKQESEGEEEESNEGSLKQEKLNVGKKGAATKRGKAKQVKDEDKPAKEDPSEEDLDGEPLGKRKKKSEAEKKGTATGELSAKTVEAGKNSSKLRVEHWNALDIQKVFLQHFPDLVVEFNPTAPRRGSFELIVTNAKGAETVLWSGLKLGPPRRLKFPDPATLVDALQKALA